MRYFAPWRSERIKCWPIESWLKVLRSDKRAIFAAASAAQRAADYVLRLANPIPDGAIALAA